MCLHIDMHMQTKALSTTVQKLGRGCECEQRSSVRLEEDVCECSEVKTLTMTDVAFMIANLHDVILCFDRMSRRT
jgi:hypothetical protein